MTIRPITAADIDAVLTLARKLFRHETLEWDAGRHRRAIEGMLASPEYGGVWVIEVDGVTAGYFVITIGYTLELGGCFALLDELFVEEAWRGRGFGTQALAFMEKWCAAHEISGLRLEVGHDNPEAQALYERAGFRVLERHYMAKMLGDCRRARE